MYQLPFNIEDTRFKDCGDFVFYNDIKDPRVQLYLRSRAVINIGYQSGALDAICRYSNVYMIPLKEDFRDGNYQEQINYI